ncbi:hypothetical protein BRC98_01390 [Halobacteriales archaeon QS_7_68_65]|nr:MAG: hypothetical protein BRC98_01390 [Halobacteriales archaeon QS_7_68_65]
MSLRIGAALREGARRTFTRDGLVLVVVFVLIGIATALATQTLLADAFDAIVETLRTEPGAAPDDLTPQEIDEIETTFESQTPFALPVSPVVAGLLLVVTAVLAEAANLVAVRALVVIAIGLVFLIVPGVFFAIAFLFLRQEIAIEDTSFVDAMADSWQLTSGDRLELFALVLGVVVLVTVISTAMPLVFEIASPLLGAVVSILLGGVTAVFGTAVVTRAYAQLHADRAVVRNGDDTDEWAV